MRCVVPEAGIEGRDKWLHAKVSMACYYLSLSIIFNKEECNINTQRLTFHDITTSMKWGASCQKQVSRAGTSDYIPQYLWDVITCPCPWHLLQAQHSSNIKTTQNIFYNYCIIAKLKWYSWIRNHTIHYSVGCNYLFTPHKPTVKSLIYATPNPNT